MKLSLSAALVVIVGASMLAGCHRGSESTGSAELNGASVPTPAAMPATAPAAASLASRVVGTWKNDDGTEILELTATTMERKYVKLNAPKAVMPYSVVKEDGSTITLAPRLVMPNGKSFVPGQQVFTLVDADTLKGGLENHAPTTLKRVH